MFGSNVFSNEKPSLGGLFSTSKPLPSLFGQSALTTSNQLPINLGQSSGILASNTPFGEAKND